MKLNYNVTGKERKNLVAAVSAALEAPATYLGMPTANYEVGDYVIDKTGTVTGPRNPELVTKLLKAGFDAETAELKAETPAPKHKGILDTLVDELNANVGDGIKWERLHSAPQMECGDGKWRNLDGTFTTQTEAGAPDTITIEIPFTSCGDLTLAKENLVALLQSKAALIQAALGGDAFWYAPPEGYSPENPGSWYGPAPADNALPIEFTDSTVKFEWFKFGVNGNILAAWEVFLCAAVNFAKKAKRVTAKDKGLPENGKFAMRTLCVKIGLNDAANKTNRKVLLRYYSAFATLESKARWQAKHLKKAK